MERPAEPHPSAPDPSAPDPAAPEEPPQLFCPVCSSHLQSQHCKLVCPRCGYYMSCADYY